ncbi:MAG TPA: YggT family protein [Ramlibacter sp.]|jgi:YGGT family.|nr:YggT family protein [Ramlibacter sp.]
MFFQITSFLLDVAAGLLGGACLLRLYMQFQRISFANPVGRFVFALTDWIVVPLRRLLPGKRRWDGASLLAAYLIELAQFGILWLLLGRVGHPGLVPVVAVFGLVRLVISGAIGLVIVAALLSWIQADSPIVDIIGRLAEPLLRPFRRVIPLVGGFDLSPLAALVLLQVAAIIVANLQDALIR